MKLSGRKDSFAILTKTLWPNLAFQFHKCLPGKVAGKRTRLNVIETTPGSIPNPIKIGKITNFTKYI